MNKEVMKTLKEKQFLFLLEEKSRTWVRRTTYKWGIVGFLSVCVLSL